ncbi:histidine phosphatase family protein [Leptolyngbya sp. AN02str]|uniref:histidine phosphatase family protein n=1 Tax=Leptolyngbya sp. AN02str TaxID=3423363 RepID=UPI003D31B871
MKLLKIMFVRHGQSTGNLQKQMQGNADFELTAEGRQQVEKLAAQLIEEGWQPTHIYTSPVKRAVQTTEVLMAHFLAEEFPTTVSDWIGGEVTAPLDWVAASGDRGPIELHYAEEVCEFKNGLFEGLTWAEAKAQYPELCTALETNLEWIPIPGAETLIDARERSRKFIHYLLDRHQNGDRVLVITHSWILQHLVAELLGCNRSWRFSSGNTAVFEFWIERARWHTQDVNRYNTDLWQIRRFNDCRHLSTMT